MAGKAGKSRGPKASLVSRISGDWGGRSWDAGGGGPGRARTKVDKVKTNNNA